MSKKLLFLGLLLFLFSCRTSKINLDENQVSRLNADVSFLASDDLEGREIGTKGEILAAEYISKQFQQIGLKGMGDDQGYYQLFQVKQKTNPHAEEAAPDDPFIEGRNVLGYMDNGSPYTIIIGAHYDHLGFGGEGSLYTKGQAIHNGADDNASGVAAMIELARRLSQKKSNNNILFMAFSGEEKGLWGSNYFNKNPTLDLQAVNYMINMDMVGRLNEERQLAIYGIGTSPDWQNNIEAIKSPEFKFTFTKSGVGPSDHTSFYLSDIPVLHFFTGQHKQYHKPSDDTELINFDGINDVASFIEKLILRLDDDGKLAFTKTADESSVAPRFQVTLGVVPDYLFDGKRDAYRWSKGR